MTKMIAVALAVLATPAFAEGTRELDSHEHGVGELNIAFEGNTNNGRRKLPLKSLSSDTRWALTFTRSMTVN